MNRGSLGDRMKKQYEDRTRTKLPRRTYTIIRLDGVHFHTYTKGFRRPFDHVLMGVLDRATIDLCHIVDGIKFAYVQSDEVSLLLTDFTNPTTESWFDGNIQKLVSVSASTLTAYFNEYMGRVKPEQRYKPLATFDSRVFTIPDSTEVENYFIWRQQDWVRNSIQAVAQSLYSPKQLHKKNNNELQEMIFQKGVNWNNYPIPIKRGRIVKKHESKGWTIDNEIPIFTQDKNYLRSLIPKYE